MSTMTPHQAWQPTAPAFGRDQACVVAGSKGMPGIDGTTSESRAFLSGNDT